MRNNETKKATVEALDVMIQNVEKVHLVFG